MNTTEEKTTLELKPSLQVFFQEEHLTTRIANILRDYPPGIGPIKEFVQNADDAKARRFGVMLDLRVSNGGSIIDGFLTKELASYDGASMIFFNDSTFSERDFQSICQLGNSMKKDDSASVGKFGLGVNVAYHFTDVVQFISDDQLIMFDPHRRVLPDSMPGLRTTFTDESFRRLHARQMHAFVTDEFGFSDASEAFDGTIFRLPLRTGQSDSLISNETIDEESLRSVLREFVAVAPEMLLFLKHVEQIDVYVRDANGTQCLAQTRIANVSEQLRASRSRHSDVARARTAAGEAAAVDESYELCITELDGTSQRWLIQAGNYVSKRANELSAALGELAWVGVAAFIDSNGAAEHTLSVDELHANRCARGTPYCFLPLPLRTGLPVHVNAHFALASNRRTLWLGNQEVGGGDGLLRERWNEMLLDEAIPRAYVQLLEAVARLVNSSDALYALWPSARAKNNFERVASATNKLIRSNDVALFYDAHSRRHWHSLRTSLLETANSALNCGLQLRAVLRDANNFIVDPPAFVLESIDLCAKEDGDVSNGDAHRPRRLTPKTCALALRSAYSKHSDVTARPTISKNKKKRGADTRSLSNAHAIAPLTFEQCAELWSFAWESDVNVDHLYVNADNSSGKSSNTVRRGDGVRRATLDALVGLRCVPLHGSGLAVLHGADMSNGASRKILCDRRWRPLLVDATSMLVDDRFGVDESGATAVDEPAERVRARASDALHWVAKCKTTAISLMTPRDLLDMMDNVVPSTWLNARCVQTVPASTARARSRIAAQSTRPDFVRADEIAAYNDETVRPLLSLARTHRRGLPECAVGDNAAALKAVIETGAPSGASAVDDSNASLHSNRRRKRKNKKDEWMLGGAGAGAGVAATENDAAGSTVSVDEAADNVELRAACEARHQMLSKRLALLWEYLLFDVTSSSLSSAAASSSVAALDAMSRKQVQELNQLLHEDSTASWRLFRSWPIVPLDNGTVVTVAEAVDVGIAFDGALHTDSERTVFAECAVPLTHIDNAALHVLTLASREHLCRSLVIAVSYVDTEMTRQQCIQVRKLVLEWQQQTDGEGEQEAPQVALKVSEVRRLPVFETLAGTLVPCSQQVGVPPLISSDDVDDDAWAANVVDTQSDGDGDSDEFARPLTWDALVDLESIRQRMLACDSDDAMRILRLAKMMQPLSERVFLEQFLSSHFNELSRRANLQVLRCVARVEPWKRKSSLQRRLEESLLVIDSDGTRLRPYNLVDPFDALLQRCLRAAVDDDDERGVRHLLESVHVRFLPPLYRSSKPTIALRHIGMQTIESADGFLLASRAVESSGDTTLGARLVQLFASLHKKRSTILWKAVDYNRLRSVRFVPCTPPPKPAEWRSALRRLAPFTTDYRNVVLPRFYRPTAIRSGSSRSAAGKLRRMGREFYAQLDDLDAQETARDEAALNEYVQSYAAMRADIGVSVAQMLDASDAVGDVVADVEMEAVLMAAKDALGHDSALSVYLGSPLLPRQVDDCEAFRARLGVPSTPATVVARHLAALCLAWSHEVSSRGQTLTAVEIRGRQALVLACLLDLDAQITRLSVGVLSTLRDLEFVVLDDGRLVRPGHIRFELEETLSLEANAPPSYLEYFEDLFQAIADSHGTASLTLRNAPAVSVQSKAPRRHERRIVDELNKERFADVCICLGGGQQKLWAHRLVLCLASDHFRNIVESGMTATPAHLLAKVPPSFLVLEAPEMASYNAMLLLLKYWYTGRVYLSSVDEGSDEEAGRKAAPNDDEEVSAESVTSACELLQLADFYDAKHLKEWCEHYLANPTVATVRNLIDLLVLADAANATQLRRTVAFRCRHTLDLVRLMSGFDELPPHLLKMIGVNNPNDP